MTPKYIFTISGSAGHGKDTFAEMMCEHLTNAGKRAIIIHFADYLKYICKQYYNWDGQKDETGRTLLQQIGTNKVRKKNPAYWVETVRDVIKTVLIDDFDVFIIPDARFPNEIELFENDEDFICHSVKVIRAEAPDTLTEEQKQHPSETALNDYLFEYVIENTSLDQFRAAAKVLVNREIIGDFRV
jgi:hypothetical protein